MASIEHRSGGWRAVWRFNGAKQHTLQWPTLDQAQQAKSLAEARRHQITAQDVERIILGEPGDGQPVGTPALSLRSWCEVWVAAKTRITPGTRGDYKRMLANQIYPILGDLPLDAIEPTDVGQWINGLRAAGLSNNTLTNYFNVLHGAFAAAVANGKRGDNPCGGTDFVRGQVADDDTGESHRVYLTPSQYSVLLRSFKPRDRPFIECLAGTGARWSEATALRKSDLLAPTFRAGPRVKIARAWKKGEDSGRYLGTTKGRRARAVEIDEFLYDMLLDEAADKNDDDFLFTSSNGHALHYPNYYRRIFRPAVVRAQRCANHPPAPESRPLPGASGRCRDHGGRRTSGAPCDAAVLPGTTRCRSHGGPRPDAVSPCECTDVLHESLSPHDLRHSHAAWLFADPDVAPMAISRRLGHANLMTTDLIYGGLSASAERAAVGAITAVLRLARGL